MDFSAKAILDSNPTDSSSLADPSHIPSVNFWNSFVRSFQRSLVPQPNKEKVRGPLAWPGLEVSLEIGCGVGLHPIQWGEKYPQEHLVAIEHTQEKCEKFLRRLENHPHLTNITAIHGNAISWVTHEFSENQFKDIYFFYPNPEPQNSAKRWIRMPFFSEILRVLRDDGQILFASNEERYISEVQDHAVKDWKLSIFERHEIRLAPGIRGRTHFERKYLGRGQTCYQVTLRK